MPERKGEKRKQERYTVKGVHGNVLYSSNLEIINISVDGLAIETAKRLDIEREYTFKIYCEDEPLNIKGRVVWSFLTQKENKETGEMTPIYNAGIQFTDIMSEKTNMLLNFISENRVMDSERRVRGIRCKIATPENIKVDYPYHFDVKKISLSGMLVETDYSLNIDNTYAMELILNDDVLNIVGRVTNCAKIEAENGVKHNIGIEFLEVSDKDKEVLKKFVHSLKES